MFINCPYCRTLVSTDPVTDLPPTHCPHCMSLLRRDDTVEDAADTEGDGAPLDLVALMNTPMMDTPVRGMPLISAAPVSATAPETDTKTAAQVAVATDADTPVDRQQDTMRDDSAIERTPEPGDATAIDTDTTTAPATKTPPPAPGKRGSRAMPSFARVASGDRKSTRLNSSHSTLSRMPSSA